MTQHESAPLVALDGLRCAYGRKVAVDGLSLNVAPGEVVALLGHNGAGKSTTLRTLLGLQRASGGTVRVLGLDPWKEGVQIRRRVGYVPEDFRAYPWMTVRETLSFVAAFHPTWDEALCAEGLRRLELPPDARLRELSRGMGMKVALLCATAFRPEALLLDDPTSGLDALVRREIVEHLIDSAAEGGRGVLLTSHVLDEVERLADRVAILVGGRLVMLRPLEDLRAALRRVTLTFEGEVPSARDLPAALTTARNGRTATLVVDGWTEDAASRARQVGATGIALDAVSLEDAFVAVVSHAKAHAEGA